MYPTLPVGVLMTACGVPTDGTGVLVTFADVIVNVRGCVAPGSWTVKVCDWSIFGNRPAFSLSRDGVSLAFTRSMPSISSTRAPRWTLLAAGEPGSVYATKYSRGGFRESADQTTPYPASTPDCEKAIQS